MLRIALCLSSFLSITAWADITIEGTHSPGLSGGLDRQVIYLRDHQLRIDQLAPVMQDGGDTGKVASSIVIRFSGQPPGLLYLDHESRTVGVISALPATAAADSAFDSAANPVHVVHREDPRQILGLTAHRYDFSFSGNVDPLVLLGEQLSPGMAGMVSIKLNVSGTSWVVPGMDGAAELAGFFTTLASKQLAVGMMGQNPSLARQQGSVVSPELSRALTEVMVRITREGFPLLTQTRSDMNVDMEGTLADMIQGILESMGMGAPQNSESIVTRVTTTTVDAGRLYDGGLPAGYTLNQFPATSIQR